MRIISKSNKQHVTFEAFPFTTLSWILIKIMALWSNSLGPNALQTIPGFWSKYVNFVFMMFGQSPVAFYQKVVNEGNNVTSF